MFIVSCEKRCFVGHVKGVSKTLKGHLLKGKRALIGRQNDIMTNKAIVMRKYNKDRVTSRRVNKLLVKALTDSTDEQMKRKADTQRPKGQRMHRPAACK